MSELTPGDFGAFFREIFKVKNDDGTFLHVEPFPWQRRLIREVSEGWRWPNTLALPTGTGKTSTLAIAVFALALDIARARAAQRPRAMPLRIVFVVDRRLIVDAAYEAALKLQRALRTSVDPVVRNVAEQLRSLCGQSLDAYAPLHVARLRGGAPREGDWTPSPAFPTIVTSTVDQIGSRLLFRGYGVSESMRPIDAGLLGEDTLILLDEVHLAEPFRQTLAAIAERRARETSPWFTVDLSATPRSTSGFTFHLSEEDRATPALARRLAAPKPTRLVRVDAIGSGLAQRYADLAIESSRLASGDARRVLVVVNRVALAREVYESLKTRLDARYPEGSVDKPSLALLIGRAREIEKRAIRSTIIEATETRLQAEDAVTPPERLFFLVATQTVEAGADLDFDAIVTQVAALDALRQRFGRIDRVGRLGRESRRASGVIVANAEELARKGDPDPIYGLAPRAVWTWMSECEAAGTLDYGVDSMERLLAATDEATVVAMTSPQTNAPTLLPSYVKHLSRTRPTPFPDVAIELFLHGPNTEPADVQIVWRADVDDPKDVIDGSRASQLLDALPPRTSEAISVPVWAARRWLRSLSGVRRLANESAMVADLEGSRARSDDRGDREGAPIWRWLGSDDGAERISPAEIRPGDVVVAPSSYGGCDEFGWKPGDGTYVRDIGAAAAGDYATRTFAVRIHSTLVKQFVVEHAEPGEKRTVVSQRHDATWKRVISRISDFDDAASILDAFPQGDQLARDAGFGPDLDRLRLANGKVQILDVYADDEDGARAGIIVAARRGVPALDDGRQGEHERGLILNDPMKERLDSSTEDDEQSGNVGSRGVSGHQHPYYLNQHGKDVRDLAHAFASISDLASPVAEDVALAAWLHDVGKVDSRFQRYLVASRWAQTGEALAKSLEVRSQSMDRSARVASGLPDRWRHEAFSVRIAMAHPRFADAHDPELVLWLIGSHHGWGRPLFPHADPEDGTPIEIRDVHGETVALDRSWSPQNPMFAFEVTDPDGILQATWAQMFDRLAERYGTWGLARLEAIVRLADHRASALHSTTKTKATA